VRSAVPLVANTSTTVCGEGQKPGHRAFVLSPDEARRLTVNDPASTAVIHPYLTGDELSGDGVPHRFLIDLAAPDAMTAAALAPKAFQHIKARVLPDRERAAERQRQANAELLAANPDARVSHYHESALEAWWQLARRRTPIVNALVSLPRYIAVSRHVSERRIPAFSFVAPTIRPSDATMAFALSDDYSFGVLQSSVHLAWFRARGSRLKNDLRYTTMTVFGTFPWPQAPAQDAVWRVVVAVAELLAFRAERMAQGITIGRQYDSLRQPGRNRLRDLHEELDRAVLDVYGFDPEEDLLDQILALNLSIAEQEQAGGAVRGPGPHGLPNATRTTWRIEPVHRLA
jgi:hypothetical protein